MPETMTLPEIEFSRLTGVDTWIFDVDNTLYPAACNLFTQVRDRMTLYISRRFGIGFDDARMLQRRYYQAYGTTMMGLMKHDGVDPHEFMEFVHDVDLAALTPSDVLKQALARLPGRRVVYTNASSAHAVRIMEHLGIADLFDGIFDIIAADYEPKPGQDAFDRMLTAHAISPRRAAFFEDIGRNLEPAEARGVATVLVRGSDLTITGAARERAYDFEVDDLPAWLAQVADRLMQREPAQPQGRVRGL